MDASSSVPDFGNIDFTERVQLMDKTHHVSSVRIGSKPPGAFAAFIVLNQRYSVDYRVRKTREGDVYDIVDGSYLDRDMVLPVIAFVNIQGFL